MRKNGFKNTNFFNHTVFLIQFGINLHERVLQKAEIAFSAF